jgi:23S rRNA pseudouridine1911/1915/1917 synthase
MVSGFESIGAQPPRVKRDPTSYAVGGFDDGRTRRMNASYPTLAAVVRERTAASWSRARALCRDGRVTVDGTPCLDPATRVGPDARVVIDPHAPKRAKGPLAENAIVYFDRDLVIVDKPAGMLSVPDEPGNKDTLAEHARLLVQRIEGKGHVPGFAVVHRLDKDTSGVMVFARNAAAQRTLAAQFGTHEIDRIYVAIAHGIVAGRSVESDLLLDRGDGLRGSHGHFRRAKGALPADARHAVTHLRPLETLRGATLVECRLDTGRQHQIRIHLAELGHPIVGERVYIRDYDGPRIEAPRTLLHARLLGFVHPRTGQRLCHEREPPEDFQGVLERLRR